MQMNWVYLSPHFDDAALSCGAIIWQQIQSGASVQIWTTGAGSPPDGDVYSPFAQSLHARWQTAPQSVVQTRQAEDLCAGQTLGAGLRYWNLPDCIYRVLPDGNYLVNGEADLFKPSHEKEAGIVTRMQSWFQEALPPDTQLVAPMTLGGHVDHRLVRAAAEGLGVPLHYYADFPYVWQYPEALPPLIMPHWRKTCFPITQQALERWCDAIACYTSQISTFWRDEQDMRRVMQSYAKEGGGACLWFAK